MDLWVELLRDGEGFVHPTDGIDSVRFSKVGSVGVGECALAWEITCRGVAA